MTRPRWPARRQEQHSDQRPATRQLRPQPALATRDAMRARDPSLRPDLQPAPATTRAIRPRPATTPCGPSRARVEHMWQEWNLWADLRAAVADAVGLRELGPSWTGQW